MAEKLCPICGKPTRVYMGNARKDGLCGTHADMLKAGEIKLNDKGIYINIKTGEILNDDKKIDKSTETTTHSQESKCIICGKETNGDKQCPLCASVTMGFAETLDKNGPIKALREHYYSLRDRIGLMKEMETTQTYCNKLIAIATTQAKIHDDTSLIDRVYRDVTTLIESKRKIIVQPQFKQKQKESDETQARVIPTLDGHQVVSDGEAKIDNILYNNYIPHRYDVIIKEIPELIKKCDWFVPISNGEGVYIEYWGMKTPGYLKSREEKEALYQKHDIPYIGIEADDPKDTQTFEAVFLRELEKKANEIFGFMPKWCKPRR